MEVYPNLNKQLPSYSDHHFRVPFLKTLNYLSTTTTCQNHGYKFGVSKVIFVHRFGCIHISKKDLFQPHKSVVIASESYIKST